jgi:hypothetical protein
LQKSPVGWARVWIVAAVVGLGAVTWLFVSTPKQTGVLPFDRGVWDSVRLMSGEEDYRRHRMADGMIASGALIGKSQEEIIALLGIPSPNGPRPNTLDYVLGRERGHIFVVDSELLAIEFGSDGRAARAYIRQD